MIRSLSPLLFLLGALSSASLSGQGVPPELTLRFTEGRMPQSQVFCVERYGDGRIAFGTLSKVLFYDGEAFEPVSVPKGKGVLSLDWSEKKKRLYVGGGSLMGELVPDGSGRLKYRSLIGQLPDSLEDIGIVWNTYAMKDGSVLFNTEEYLFRLKGEAVKVFRPERKFYEMYMVDGIPVIQDVDTGLFRVHKDRKRFLKGSGAIVKDAEVRSILPSGPDDQNEVWTVVTRSGGFFRYDRSKGEVDRLRDLHEESDIEQVLKEKVHTAVRLDPERNIYGASYVVGTELNGIRFLDAQGRSLLHLGRDDRIPASLIWSMFKDRRGNLWTTTNKGIALLHTGVPFGNFQEGDHYQGKISGLAQWSGKPYSKEKDAPFFMATSQGVLVQENGEFSRVRGTEGQCGGLLFYRDEEKNGRERSNLVIAAGRKGLMKAIPPSGKGNWKARTLFSETARTVDRVPGHSLPSGSDLLIVGGRNGLYVLEGSSGKKGWEEKASVQKVPEGIKSVGWEKGQSGDDSLLIWGGTRSKGVLRIRMSLSDGGYRSSRFDTSDGLPPGSINVFPDPEEEGVVFGSERGLFDHQDGSFRPNCSFGKIFCDRSREIFRLVDGRNGELWINDVKGGQVKHLRKEGNRYRIDSLPFRSMGSVGNIRDFLPKDDRCWIGGSQGLICYFPGVEHRIESSWDCWLKEVRVAGDSLLFGGHYRKRSEGKEQVWSFQQKQPDAMVPVLPFRKGRVEFKYAAAFPDAQDSVRYRYKLEGFDTAWSRYSEKTRKEYTSLPEGDYSFRVHAVNVYGKKSREASYRFRILPPWYRTWWAYSGYSLGGIGFLWLLLWLNGRRLRAQKERLEGIVRERTKEIREQKELVEAQQHETEKQRRIAEERREKIEEAHQEITQSIDYAQKIQNALLQSEEYVSDHLPEHFILFKPQASVSGDFYWAREQNGALYLASIDCTGHGVPGAFMSMLGISQLNEIMNTNEELSPGEILTRLRERVVRELSGADAAETAKDGMDAAMVRIPLDKAQDPNSKFQNPRGEDIELQFAGAQNPLYVIRKGIGEAPPSVESYVGNDRDRSVQDRLKPFKRSPDGIEIKGDPMPVGYDEYASGDFTTVSLQVQKGDMLYIFSDGYADQFGGPKGKKFRYGPFKQLLVDIHEKSLEQQKRDLDRTFEDWKEESQQEQIDDVLVIGIRI